MNWPASSETGVVLPALAEPEIETRAKPALGEAAEEWLCAWCHHRVASERDRFRYEGKSEFAFSNPEGMGFVILTFSQTLGCMESGAPTLEHTWFPGHAWSYCQCERCGLHLGWHYSGPHDFAGLIKERIIRGLHARN